MFCDSRIFLKLSILLGRLSIQFSLIWAMIRGERVRQYQIEMIVSLGEMYANRDVRNGNKLLEVYT